MVLKKLKKKIKAKVREVKKIRKETKKVEKEIKKKVREARLKEKEVQAIKVARERERLKGVRRIQAMRRPGLSYGHDPLFQRKIAKKTKIKKAVKRKTKIPKRKRLTEIKSVAPREPDNFDFLMRM